MKGGARVRSGPSADPNAVQPEQFTELPDHREGEAPRWPIVPNATKREREIWSDVWRLPQALQWEQRHLEAAVAIYVRTRTRAERRDATVGLLAEWRRQEDSLGLSIGGYRAAKFTPQVNPTPAAKSRQRATAGMPARWKPEVIDGAG